MEILLILSGFMLAIIIMVIYEIKLRKPQNNIHFYIQRDRDGIFHFSIGKLNRESKLGFWMPISGKSYIIASSNTYLSYFKGFNLSFPEHENLTWEDEPVEVFLDMES